MHLQALFFLVIFTLIYNDPISSFLSPKKTMIFVVVFLCSTFSQLSSGIQNHTLFEHFQINRCPCYEKDRVPTPEEESQ